MSRGNVVTAGAGIRNGVEAVQQAVGRIWSVARDFKVAWNRESCSEGLIASL